MDELKKELEELNRKEFMLNMCDIWDSSDYRYSQELHQKIMEVKNKIKELEKNGKN